MQGKLGSTKQASLPHLTMPPGETTHLPLDLSRSHRSGSAGTNFVTFGDYKHIIISWGVGCNCRFSPSVVASTEWCFRTAVRPSIWVRSQPLEAKGNAAARRQRCGRLGAFQQPARDPFCGRGYCFSPSRPSSSKNSPAPRQFSAPQTGHCSRDRATIFSKAMASILKWSAWQGTPPPRRYRSRSVTPAAPTKAFRLYTLGCGDSSARKSCK